MMCQNNYVSSVTEQNTIVFAKQIHWNFTIKFVLLLFVNIMRHFQVGGGIFGGRCKEIYNAA